MATLTLIAMTVALGCAGYRLRKSRIRLEAWKNFAIALEAQYDCLVEASEAAQEPGGVPRRRIANWTTQLTNCSTEIQRLRYELVYLGEYS